jgi:hypothetical protein
LQTERKNGSAIPVVAGLLFWIAGIFVVFSGVACIERHDGCQRLDLINFAGFGTILLVPAFLVHYIVRKIIKAK